MTTIQETRMHVPAVSFGERIELLRGDRTQSEVGRALGVSQQAVSYWESGGIKDLKPDNLLAAADYFGVSIRWLVTGRNGLDNHGALPPLAEPNIDPEALSLARAIEALSPDTQRHLSALVTALSRQVVTLDIRCAACGSRGPVRITIQ